MSLIGSVTLERAFLSLASNPATYVMCGTAGSIGGGGQRSDVYTQEGTFRPYANGVTRLILGSQNSKTIALVARALTPAQFATLSSMIGKTCLLRDTYGRRVFGSFLVTTATDIPLSGDSDSTSLRDVAIDFTQVSYTEAV